MSLKPDRARRQSLGGFTLVELLVVVAIIATLITLIVPAIQSARESSRRAQCINNLRQVGLGILNFESARGAIPGAHDANIWSWIAQTLPYLDESNLSDVIDYALFAMPRRADHNSPLVATPLPILNCVSDTTSSGTTQELAPGIRFAYTSYLGVTGTHDGTPARDYTADGMFPSTVPYVVFPPAARPLPLRRVTDGTSKTLMVGERPVVNFFTPGFGDSGWWATGHGHPAVIGRADYVLDSSQGLRPGSDTSNSYDDAFHWWSFHPGGAQFVLADGSARFLSYDIHHHTMLGLSSRHDGEPTSAE